MAYIDSNKFTIKINRVTIGELGENGRVQSTIIIYKGNIRLTPVSSTPTDGQFLVTISETDNCTASIKELDTIYVNTLTENKGNIKLSINVENKATFIKNIKLIKSISKDEITNINTRINIAEEKITNEAITNVVSESFYTKEEITKSYATKSEVIQTKDSVVQAFTSNGGYNLLYNGNFEKGLTDWNSDGDVFAKVDIDTPSGYSVHMQGVIGGTRAIHQHNIKLSPSVNNYVLSWYQYTTNGTDGTTNCFRRPEVTIYYTDGTSTWHNQSTDGTYNQEVIGQWVKRSILITRPIDKKFSTANVGLWCRDTDRIVLYSDVMLEKGTVATEWTPNPNEIYDGIITANKDGIKVEMRDGEGSQGYSLVSYDGFSVFDSNGSRTAWFGQDDSSYINRLYTNDIICNKILKKRGADTPNVFYVNANPPSGSNQSGTSVSNACSSINEVLSKIKSTYGEYSAWRDIYIDVAAGSYNETVDIMGFIGCGVITINLSADAIIYGKWRIYDNTMKVVINGNRTGGNATNNGAQLILTDESYNALFYIRNCHCTIQNLRAINKCHPKSSTDRYGCAFASLECARCTILNCDMSRFYYGIYAAESSMGCIAGCRGYTYYAGVSRYGSYIGMADYPSQKEHIWADWGGHFITNDVGFESLYDAGYESTSTPPPTTPPPTTPTVFTQSFTVTNLKSIPEGSGNSTSTRTGVMGQGKWGSYKPHRGWGTIPSSLRDFCSGGSNISMTITMTRQNTSHGYAGAVPSPKFVYSGGTWDSGVKFARGDTKTITLPSTIVSQIANGTITDIQLWAGASTNDYSFYEKVAISVTCTKNI
jgi:hypothetical protein